MSKGRISYVPRSVFDELKNIMDEEKVDKQSEAFRKMSEFSAIGRQTKKEQWIWFNKQRFNK